MCSYSYSYSYSVQKLNLTLGKDKDYFKLNEDTYMYLFTTEQCLVKKFKKKYTLKMREILAEKNPQILYSLNRFLY
jgi:hypothetical protein